MFRTIFLFCLLLTACVGTGPHFAFERDDGVFEVPGGSIGEIPPVLETVHLFTYGSAEMASARYSLFGVVSPVSQNKMRSTTFQMTNSMLAIGAHGLGGLQTTEQ